MSVNIETYPWPPGHSWANWYPYRDRVVDPLRPVEVYRHIRPSTLRGSAAAHHRTYGGPMYSVRQAGRVVAHVAEIRIRDATLHVGQAGRRRVIETGQKNVHAWIRGQIAGLSAESAYDHIRYNPREHTTFVDASGRPIMFVALAVIGAFGVKVKRHPA